MSRCLRYGREFNAIPRLACANAEAGGTVFSKLILRVTWEKTYKVSGHGYTISSFQRGGVRKHGSRAIHEKS